MAVMRTPIFVPRGPANQESSSVPTGAACHRAMCVMPRTTVEMDQMNHLKPAVSGSFSELKPWKNKKMIHGALQKPQSYTLHFMTLIHITNRGSFCACSRNLTLKLQDKLPDFDSIDLSVI